MRNYLDSTTYNIAWFKKLNDDNLLEISPPFQRKPVWTDKQKSYLMDSILGGYPIPEIYLQESITAEGKSKLVVVDGQQRIRAVLAYIDDKYAIEDSETTKWKDLKFSDLSESDKKSFYAYKFVVRLLPEISDEEIRGIFQRINKNNVSLNAQELRQSTYSGDFLKIINDISDREYWKDLAIFTPAKIRRMLDAEYISEIAIAYLNGHQNKKKKLDYYYTLYEDNFDEKDEISAIFDKVCCEIIQLLPDIKTTRWTNMVDFYTLFLVLAQYKFAIPFSSDTRKKLAKMLYDFSTIVIALQKEEPDVDPPPNENHKLYAAGIRNSSDLASRRQRYNSLASEVAQIFNPA